MEGETETETDTAAEAERGREGERERERRERIGSLVSKQRKHTFHGGAIKPHALCSVNGGYTSGEPWQLSLPRASRAGAFAPVALCRHLHGSKGRG